MRLATYNVENLFSRARALNLPTWSEGGAILNCYSEINKLFENEVYSDADKARILELLTKLGLDKKDEGHFAILRKSRGDLIKRSVVGGPRVSSRRAAPIGSAGSNSRRRLSTSRRPAIRRRWCATSAPTCSPYARRKGAAS